MGRHTRRVSDQRLTVVLVWQGFGVVAMTAALLAIAVIGLGASSGSGTTINHVSLAFATELQRLAITTGTAVTVTRQLDQAIGQIGRVHLATDHILALPLC